MCNYVYIQKRTQKMGYWCDRALSSRISAIRASVLTTELPPELLVLVFFAKEIHF